MWYPLGIPCYGCLTDVRTIDRANCSSTSYVIAQLGVHTRTTYTSSPRHKWTCVANRAIDMHADWRACMYMYVRRYHRREEQKGLTYVFVDEVHCNLVANDTFKMMKILV